MIKIRSMQCLCTLYENWYLASHNSMSMSWARCAQLTDAVPRAVELPLDVSSQKLSKRVLESDCSLIHTNQGPNLFLLQRDTICNDLVLELLSCQILSRRVDHSEGPQQSLVESRSHVRKYLQARWLTNAGATFCTTKQEAARCKWLQRRGGQVWSKKDGRVASNVPIAAICRTVFCNLIGQSWIWA